MVSEKSELDYSDDLEILNKIGMILSGLGQNRKRKLLNTLSSLYGLGVEANTSTSAETKAEPIPNSHGSERSSFSENRTVTIKEFMLQKKPASDVEKVACLAYYLTHYKNTPHFKTFDISKLNTDGAQIKFSNAAHAVDNATKVGYLVQGNKGQKQLSAIGEMYVQNLPDRDAAREAIKHNRPRKFRGRK